MQVIASLIGRKWNLVLLISIVINHFDTAHSIKCYRCLEMSGDTSDLGRNTTSTECMNKETVDCWKDSTSCVWSTTIAYRPKAFTYTRQDCGDRSEVTVECETSDSSDAQDVLQRRSISCTCASDNCNVPVKVAESQTGGGSLARWSGQSSGCARNYAAFSETVTILLTMWYACKSHTSFTD